MKQIYNFPVKIGKKKVKVFLKKPSRSEINDGEYVYGKKFNLLIQDGYMTRAMMDKKFGDIGGIYSEKSSEELGHAIKEIIDAKRKIEFYGGAKDLTKEQEEDLKKAEEAYSILQKGIVEQDIRLKEMYSHSAESKAEEHLIKWFILNFTYFFEKVGDKEEAFKLFEGSSFKEKLNELDVLFEDEEEDDTVLVKKKKKILKESLPTLNKVVSIWYNGFGDTQKEIEKSLAEFFPEDE